MLGHQLYKINMSNYQPLEVVYRGSETQLQMSENKRKNNRIRVNSFSFPANKIPSENDVSYHFSKYISCSEVSFEHKLML